MRLAGMTASLKQPSRSLHLLSLVSSTTPTMKRLSILLWQLLRTVLLSRITLQTPSRCSALSSRLGVCRQTRKKGGERNQAMVEAFQFYNAYQDARLNTPFQDFMDADFEVRELIAFMNQFNEANGTNASLSVSENMDTVVKGGLVLGAKDWTGLLPEHSRQL